MSEVRLLFVLLVSLRFTLFFFLSSLLICCSLIVFVYCLGGFIGYWFLLVFLLYILVSSLLDFACECSFCF